MHHLKNATFKMNNASSDLLTVITKFLQFGWSKCERLWLKCTHNACSILTKWQLLRMTHGQKRELHQLMSRPHDPCELLRWREWKKGLSCGGRTSRSGRRLFKARLINRWLPNQDNPEDDFRWTQNLKTMSIEELLWFDPTLMLFGQTCGWKLPTNLHCDSPWLSEIQALE